MRIHCGSIAIRILLVLWTSLNIAISPVDAGWVPLSPGQASEAPPDREIFSVAPMMAHTHRHYRYFFRKLSRRSHMYTEMIPASQIVNLFEKATGRPLGNDLSPEQVWSVVHRTSPLEPQIGVNSLHELLRLSTHMEHPVVLQLGGRDPVLLAQAAAIGTAFGYDGINLNCGCPSNAVSMGDRSGGVSLMNQPAHVAKCVEAMSQSMSRMEEVTERGKPILSIKHRVGVADAATYNADADRQRNDDDAFRACREFVRTVTQSGDVAKLHIHARLGLLGDFQGSSQEPALWVPGQESQGNDQRVDHKREQYRAKRRARMATIQNRSVPPLRPNVVNMVAEEFPNIDFVTNGGINSVQELKDRLTGVPTNVVGGMVGRAVINHPCAFATVDSLWSSHESGSVPTRGAVLQDYMHYCIMEEDRLKVLGATPNSIEALRRRLVAVPFNLFAGEKGHEAFQRRIRKLIARPDRHASYAILTAASSEIPSESLDRMVTSNVAMSDIPIYNFAQRSGPLQRSIL